MRVNNEHFGWLLAAVALALISVPAACGPRTESGQPDRTPTLSEGAPTRNTNSANNQEPTDFTDASLTPEHVSAAKDLQGTWAVISFHSDGESTPVRQGLVIPYTFDGNKLVTVGPFNAKVEIEFRLDPTRKPKQIDQRFTGGRIGPWIAKGIYEQRGDTLTICYGGPNVLRPTEFETKPGDGRSMRVHRRVE